MKEELTDPGEDPACGGLQLVRIQVDQVIDGGFSEVESVRKPHPEYSTLGTGLTTTKGVNVGGIDTIIDSSRIVHKRWIVCDQVLSFRQQEVAVGSESQS